MGEAWRIVKVKHAATAFDGEGARLNGGRWNSVGVRTVYVSATKSLAALETLVHLKLPVASKYVAIPLQFDLINPAHPDFSKIKIGKPVPFTFDPRLLT